MTLDLDAIEARAKAARETGEDWYLAANIQDDIGCPCADADHIAGLDPGTVLAMVAEIRRLRGTP